MWLSLMRMRRARQTLVFHQAVTALIGAYWPKLVRPTTVDANEVLEEGELQPKLSSEGAPPKEGPAPQGQA